MDRLHPHCYFLEGLLPQLHRAECVQAYGEGLATISRLLHEIAPEFVRSDVYAQLLRARLSAAAVIPVDCAAAEAEADALATFQVMSDDPRMDGGFCFGGFHLGTPHASMSPHINPVSTSFGLQALEAWRRYQGGSEALCARQLI
jgi:hypothetical protein